MIPNANKLKLKVLGKMDQIAAKKMGEGLHSKASTHIIFEGQNMFFKNSKLSDLELSVKKIESRTTIKNDERKSHVEIASDLGRQLATALDDKMIEDITKSAVGMSNSKEDTIHDQFLKYYQLSPLEFNVDGTINKPLILVTEETSNILFEKFEEESQDTNYNSEYKKIIALKYEKYIRERNSRKLVKTVS